MHRKLGLFVALVLLSQFCLAKDVTVSYNFPLGSGKGDLSQTISLDGDSNSYTAFVRVAEANALGLDIQYYDFDGDGIAESAFIGGVDGISGTADYSNYWQFSISNAAAMAGVSSHVPSDGSTISLDYLEGGVKDAFEWLADNQDDSGIIGSNYFQSSFAMMALSLAEDNGITLGGGTISSGLSYLLDLQDEDSGFGGSDLTTAVVLMALLSNGKTLGGLDVNGTNPAELLASRQQDNGGFTGWSGYPADVDTTSWAIMAFSQAGAGLPEKNGNSAVDYLVSAQHDNGSFGYNEDDETESIDYTEEALIAFAAAEYSGSGAGNALNWLKLQQDGQGCIQDGFRTALGAIAFRLHNETEAKEDALACLETLKNGDGSFGRSTNSSNAMDTGIAAIALSGGTLPVPASSGGGSGDSNGVVGLNSLVKFIVTIKNTGRVRAENVGVSLEGIPADWVYSSEQGSIDSFEEILPGETAEAEIYVRVKEPGAYSVNASVSSAQMLSKVLSNSKSIEVEEASLEATLRLG